MRFRAGGVQGCRVMGEGWRRKLGTAGLSVQGQGSSEAAAGCSEGLTSCASADLHPPTPLQVPLHHHLLLLLQEFYPHPQYQKPHPNAGSFLPPPHTHSQCTHAHAAICLREGSLFSDCSLTVSSTLMVQKLAPHPEQKPQGHVTILRKTSSDKLCLHLQTPSEAGRSFPKRVTHYLEAELLRRRTENGATLNVQRLVKLLRQRTQVFRRLKPLHLLFLTIVHIQDDCV